MDTFRRTSLDPEAPQNTTLVIEASTLGGWLTKMKLAAANVAQTQPTGFARVCCFSIGTAKHRHLTDDQVALPFTFTSMTPARTISPPKSIGQPGTSPAT